MKAIVRFFPLFLIFVFPLIHLPSHPNYSETPKFYFLLFSALVLLITLKPQIPRIPLLFLLVLFLASILGVNFFTSFWGSFWRQQGLLTFTCLFIVFLAFFQSQIHPLHFSLAVFLSLIPIFLRPFNSTLGHPNYQAAYLALTMPFVFYLLLTSKKLFFLLSLPFYAFLIYHSQSRLALFLFLVNLLVFLALWLKQNYLYLPIALLFFLALPFVQEPSFTENRFRFWPQALQAIQAKPLLGWGLENFYPALTSILTPTDLGLRDLFIDKAHNEFLEIAIAAGIPGLVLFLLLVVAAFKKLFFHPSPWSTTLIWFLILFLIRASFNPLSLAEMFLFWSTLGLSYRQTRLPSTKDPVHFKSSSH